MKILTIVGARPQFIKAAMVSRAIAVSDLDITEEIIHTGQHYDPGMSQIFFDQLGIPEPAVNLEIGSGGHGETTGKMLAAIESELTARKPDWLLVYGDTNSTLAGALAAAKLHIPVAHVEAGLRSFNRKMPEEVNRVLTDHISELLFCPTIAAVENLKTEGIAAGVSHVGDVMYDAALCFGEIAQRESSILNKLKLSEGGFILTTIHRAENTDEKDRLSSILAALNDLVTSKPVILPLHPRTRKMITTFGLEDQLRTITVTDPLAYLDMVRLEQAASLILTDSGGVQKEAYFHGTPCVTLRDETEWVETVSHGWNQIVGSNRKAILQAASAASPGTEIKEFGNGKTSEAILEQITN